MTQHIKALGILHIVFGALGIFAGLIVLVVMGGIGVVGSQNGGDDVTLPVMGGIGAFVFAILLILSLPGLIAGIGLLQFKPWARVLTIVLSALELLNVPFGTALGIYGLWTLLSRESEALFARPPYAAVPAPYQPAPYPPGPYNPGPPPQA